jgi:hypothetical protein
VLEQQQEAARQEAALRQAARRDGEVPAHPASAWGGSGGGAKPDRSRRKK